jgi:hypothetical protein
VEKPQELVSFKKYMPPPFTKEAEGAYIFWMKQVPVGKTLDIAGIIHLTQVLRKGKQFLLH